MTDIDDRRKWLALLKAELARRAARVAWEADEGERQRQWLISTLQEMAERFAATAHLHPFDLADMAPAELLAVRCFLPEDLWPPGLPSEAAIWAFVEARRGAPAG